MKKNLKSLLSLILAVILSLSCIVAVADDIAESDLVAQYGAGRVKAYFANLTIQMADTYYYGVTDEDLLYKALCTTIDNGKFDFDIAVSGMMELLDDEYGGFFPSERFDSMYDSIAGEFFGIGVQITLSNDHVVVAGVFPNSPAEKAGIKLYDIIESVDGVSVIGKSTSDIANMIKRERGKAVEIGIQRDGKAMSVICFCDAVDQNPLVYEILEDGKIGYIYLSTFSLKVDEYITPILKEFEEKGIKNIILDIRDNGGGELNAAKSLASHFIPEGTIAKFKYRNEENNYDITVENGMTQSPYNMVLLVNENSASASELFSGAVKDRKAGTIIGTQTFGKGSMQTMFRLWSGAGIKYTVAEFHSPNDTRIHTVGITPDIVVENSVKTITEADMKKLDFDKVKDTTEGEHILAVEERLYALGYLIEEPDMVFDENTVGALKEFQMLNNLEITGETDFYTLIYMDSLIYEFDVIVDDQLEAAKNYLLTGKIN